MKKLTVAAVFLMALLLPVVSFSDEPLAPLQRKMTVLIPAGVDPDVTGGGSEGEAIRYFTYYANVINRYEVTYETNIVTNKTGELNDTAGRLINLLGALESAKGGLVSWGMHAFNLSTLGVEYWTMEGDSRDIPSPCENEAVNRANEYYTSGVGDYSFPDNSFGWWSLYEPSEIPSFLT